jgi:hypothetical protein
VLIPNIGARGKWTTVVPSNSCSGSEVWDYDGDGPNRNGHTISSASS